MPAKRASPRSSAIAALALLGTPAAAAGLSAQAHFDGVFVPGSPAEVAVEIVSDPGGTAWITVLSTGFRLRREALVEAGRPVRMALPVRPDVGGRIEIVAELPDGSRPTETLLLTSAGRPVAIDAVGALPETPSGYGPVDRIRISPARLAALSDLETTALAAYLARCGALMLVDASPAMLPGLRAAAGCGGRRVAPEPLPAPPPPAPVPPPPPPDSAQPQRIAMLLLPYPLLLGAFAVLRRPGPWLLLIPAATALIIAGALPKIASELQARTQAVMETGDPAYRWRAVLLASGGGRPMAPLPLSPGSLLPRGLDGHGVELVQRADEAEPALLLPGRLLQQRRYELTGTASTLPIASALPGGNDRTRGRAQLFLQQHTDP